jgi:hypothetical protein
MFYGHHSRLSYDTTKRDPDESKTVYGGSPKTVFCVFLQQNEKEIWEKSGYTKGWSQISFYSDPHGV